MIKRITLSSIQIFDKDKEGKPLTYKDKNTGAMRRYKRILIRSDDFEGTASGFIGSPADPKNAWQAGMEVSINLEKNGQYLNFSEPSRLDLLEARIQTLEEEMKKMKGENPLLETTAEEPGVGPDYGNYKDGLSW